MEIRCEFTENFDTAQRLWHKKGSRCKYANTPIAMVHFSIIMVVYFSITIYS